MTGLGSPTPLSTLATDGAGVSLLERLLRAFAFLTPQSSVINWTLKPFPQDVHRDCISVLLPSFHPASPAPPRLRTLPTHLAEKASSLWSGQHGMVVRAGTETGLLDLHIARTLPL